MIESVVTVIEATILVAMAAETPVTLADEARSNWKSFTYSKFQV